MSTLADVLARGQGIERPFVCEEHDDHSASASVNVLKGLWHCYVCMASGRVDTKNKKAPAIAELEAMLTPEQAGRIYPEAYLELFVNDLGNWPKRFPTWLRWNCGLGCDPLTGDATFPVRTPNGALAGVGRRIEDPGPDENRFMYPPRWSSSRSLFLAGEPFEVLALTEGASDASAIAETGLFGAACYGSGLHAPQYELIARLSPKLVLLAFDDDDAGHRAIEGFTSSNGKRMPGARELLSKSYEVAVVNWGELDVKDAAAASMPARRELLSKIVGGTYYGATKTTFEALMVVRATELQAAYYTHLEETNG